jgi:hypothetical protein
MQGPSELLRVFLTDSTAHDLLWVVGYDAAIVDADSRAPMSAEYMCHSNMDLDLARHRQNFPGTRFPTRRIFTLSEGQVAVRLPDGYGIPIRADEPLKVTAQVLNHNHHGAPIRVRQRITVHFVRDRGLRRPLTPLYQTAVTTLVRLDGPEGGYGTPVADAEHHHHAEPEGVAADTSPYRDKSGRAFAGHWVVKPGREVRHTAVSPWLDLTSDQTIRFASVHLHPFGESLELRDLTSGPTVLASRATNHAERIGLAHVEQFALPHGLALHKDHQYDLVSTYDNTSGANRTAMAVMYLYVEDRIRPRE